MDDQLASLKVIIADDNVHLRMIVVSILAGVGVTRVKEFSDGEQAFHGVRDWTPDIAIVDFRMHPVDGVQFTKQVRNLTDKTKSELPIIMLTGYADKARVFEARDAGVTELIVKPLTAQALFDRVNAVIYRPRPFIRVATYCGPCRRRRTDPAFAGPYRRETDPKFRGQKSYSLGDT